MTDFRALCAELLAEWDSYGSGGDAWDRARAELAQPEPKGPSDEELDHWWAEIDGGPDCCAWRPYARAVLQRWGRPAIEPEERWYPSFADWLEREMPEGTVIGDPLWWASRIATYLQRHARPAIEPEGMPDHVNLIGFALEREPWATWLRRGGFLESAHCELSDLMLAVLARWGRPAIEPVPVSERLPEPGVKVLAHYFNSHGKSRTVCARWIPAKFESRDPETDDLLEYDEDSDTFYWPEGWYEEIENWDDYQCVTINEGEVTHWQPLPHWALPVPSSPTNE